MMDGFIWGIQSKMDTLKATIVQVVSTVSALIGFHSPSKEGEGQHIVDWGSNMIQGFMSGIQSKLPDLQTLMNTVIKAPSLMTSVNTGVPGSSSGSSSSSTASIFNVTIDAKNVSDFNSVVNTFNGLKQAARSN